MNVVAIITARWNSERLPGKMLADIGGKPLLRHVVDNVRRSIVNNTVVATSENSQPIIDYCEGNNIPYYAGSENDILDRLYRCATKFFARAIVRVWGDSPLISPDLINTALAEWPAWDWYFTVRSNRMGYSVAVMSDVVLENTWHTVTNPKDREWVHKYLSEHYHKTARMMVDDETYVGGFTVDTLEDLERVRAYCNAGIC